MKKKIYLAGPISGLNYAGAVDWRDGIRDRLFDAAYEVYDPMRGKKFLASLDVIDHTQTEKIGNPLSSASGIMDRDTKDVADCDVLLVNLLPETVAGRLSIGTYAEMMLAHYLGKIVILVAPLDHDPVPGHHLPKHPMYSRMWSYRVDTLEEGVLLCEAYTAGVYE